MVRFRAVAVVYLNGEWLDAEQARVPVNDRGFLFGDVVYESIRLLHGRYFRFDQHYHRLAEAAALLRIPLPTCAELIAAAAELARRNALREAVLRVTLTRGPGGRGLGTIGAGPPNLLLTLRDLGDDWRAKASRGWRVITARTPHPASGRLPLPLKGQFRLHAIMARLEADDAAADDALLLSLDGHIAEGTSWNIFWRQGQHLFTPALDVGILAGLTRQLILRIATELDMPVKEGRWPRAQVDHADEVFATMTSLAVVPLRQLDDRLLHPDSDDVAPLLRERYWQLAASEAGSPDTEP